MSLRVILRSFVCSQKVRFHLVICISGSGLLSQCKPALLIFTWASLIFGLFFVFSAQPCLFASGCQDEFVNNNRFIIITA